MNNYKNVTKYFAQEKVKKETKIGRCQSQLLFMSGNILEVVKQVATRSMMRTVMMMWWSKRCSRNTSLHVTISITISTSISIVISKVEMMRILSMVLLPYFISSYVMSGQQFIMTKVEKAQLFIYFSPKINLAVVSEVSLKVKVYLSSINHEPSILTMRHDGQKRKIIRKMCI